MAALETKLIQANFLESMLIAQVRIVNLSVVWKLRRSYTLGCAHDSTEAKEWRQRKP